MLLPRRHSSPYSDPMEHPEAHQMGRPDPVTGEWSTQGGEERPSYVMLWVVGAIVLVIGATLTGVMVALVKAAHFAW